MVCVSFSTTKASYFAVAKQQSGSAGQSIEQTCQTISLSVSEGGCFGDTQLRYVISKYPDNCILSPSQQATLSRACQIQPVSHATSSSSYPAGYFGCKNIC